MGISNSWTLLELQVQEHKSQEELMLFTETSPLRPTFREAQSDPSLWVTVRQERGTSDGCQPSRQQLGTMRAIPPQLAQ